VRTSPEAFTAKFEKLSPTRIVIEVGAHSPWVSRILQAQGHEIIVANARKVRLIYESSSKNDRLDARMLARLGRVDVNLLSPVQHRSSDVQEDLAVPHNGRRLFRFWRDEDKRRSARKPEPESNINCPSRFKSPYLPYQIRKRVGEPEAMFQPASSLIFSLVLYSWITGPYRSRRQRRSGWPRNPREDRRILRLPMQRHSCS